MALAVSWPWNAICAIIIVAAIVYYLRLRFKRKRVTQYGDAPWEIEARTLDISAPSGKKKIKGKTQAAPFQQARNESYEETACLVKDNKKGKSKRD